MSDYCNPMDCSPSGSSVHRLFQARILEWVTISSPHRPGSIIYAHLIYAVQVNLVPSIHSLCASLVAQSVKNLPALQEIQVQFLGREDPLEKEMATHSSILAWKSLWTEEPSGPQPMGLQELDTTW